MNPQAEEPSASDSIRIVEVSPRDGLQSIPQHIPTSAKLELISRLSRTGLRTIELTSIVSPRAVPQLSDCRQVLNHEIVRDLHRPESGMRLPVLVPNLKGLDIAIAHGVQEVAVFVSATEEFSKANTRCSVTEALERARDVASRAIAAGMSVRGYISAIFTDPMTEDPTPHSAVLSCITSLLESGIYEISLGDTTGVGTPSLVRSLLAYLSANGIAMSKLAGHFHDSYGEALRNVWEAYLCGVRVFDSSVAGLGGCPFAPGARGNVATEEVVELFEGKGIGTGVEMGPLEETGRWVKDVLEELEGVAGAGTADERKEEVVVMAAGGSSSDFRRDVKTSVDVHAVLLPGRGGSSGVHSRIPAVGEVGLAT
ncbi:hydroxymethylglutaryl-CoA lyase [Aspergillus lucknowensis]|uniref:hydroxymethylglutaryl-CoA lyase n=1 Tax=Aspergillus lucknowensis TaxID=176173 RepID=A0ABR4LK68_9EURO